MESFHIGAGQDDGLNFFFDGNIDDVSIWDEALDESSIQAIMMNGVASTIPEPSSLSFFAFAGLALIRRRR